MTSGPGTTPKPGPSFAAVIGAKAARKQRARNHLAAGVWFGLGMMGLVGWSVVVPTLFGAGLGIWLDRHHRGRHAWTLVLLMAGLALRHGERPPTKEDPAGEH